MKWNIKRNAPISLAQQIYQEITDRILSGYFPSGSRLPSVRSLARELKVSPVTILQAFHLLSDRGLITRVQGKGTFVNHPAEEKEDHTIEEESYQPAIQDFQIPHHPVEISFARSIVHPDLLPATSLAASTQQVIRHNPEILVQYGEIQGDRSLRKAFATYLSAEQIEVNADQLLVTNGSQQGIDLVARCMLGPGDVVITEEATYSRAIDVFRSRGVVVVPVAMDEEGLSIKQLTRQLDHYTPKLIYTIPTFQNPTGRVMSMNRRRALLQLAEDLQCFILEDDPWSEIYFETPPPPAIKSLDRTGQVIYLKGLSKVLAPGCRVGFLTASEPIIRRLMTTKTYADMGNPLLNQRILYPIFQERQIDQLLQQLRQDLGQRRKWALQLLQQHAPADVKWLDPLGGLNIWLSLPEGTNTLDLLYMTKQKGLEFFPGAACFPRDLQTRYLRLSFSNSSIKDIQQGIPLLCQFIHTYLQQWKQKKTTPPIF